MKNNIFFKILRNIRLVLKCFSFKSIGRYIKLIQFYVEDSVLPFNNITVGCEVNIHPSVNFKSSENIYIGNRVRIQPHVFLWASPESKIVIDDLTGIGPGTKIFSSNHKYVFGEIYIDQPWVEKDILIGKNVWIGANCLITAGVKIGDGTVVGAGSVVTRDVPSNCLVVGSPARIVRED